VEPQDGSVLNGAIRETMEEVGVDAKDLRHRSPLSPLFLEMIMDIHESDCHLRGYLIFYFESNPAWDMRVHVYSGTKWTGEPAESEGRGASEYAKIAIFDIICRICRNEATMVP